MKIALLINLWFSHSTMISLSTAKLLLFIAVLLGPKGGDTIQITNQNAYCVWTQESSNWTLTDLGAMNAHWPENGTNISAADLRQTHNGDFKIAREITAHNWTRDSVLYLANGDKVEKQGNKIFYTTNPGGANQQIYTILTVADGKTL